MERLAQELDSETADVEDAAVADAMRRLDIDWRGVTGAAREKAITGAGSALALVAAAAVPIVSRILGAKAPTLIGDTKASMVRTHSLGIRSSLSLRDERIAQWVKDSNTLFVRDAYKNRDAVFSERARQVVASGLDKGLGRDEIARDLKAITDGTRAARSVAYWRDIAATFANRARSATQIGALSEAGFTRWRRQSMLDEASCGACRALHNMTWTVKDTERRITQAANLSDPEDVKRLTPFVHEGVDDEGKPALWFRNAEGGKQIVANIIQSAGNRWNATGTYDWKMTPDEIGAAGADLPPSHCKCRCVVTPA